MDQRLPIILQMLSASFIFFDLIGEKRLNKVSTVLRKKFNFEKVSNTIKLLIELLKLKLQLIGTGDDDFASYEDKLATRAREAKLNKLALIALIKIRKDEYAKRLKVHETSKKIGYILAIISILLSGYYTFFDLDGSIFPDREYLLIKILAFLFETLFFLIFSLGLSFFMISYVGYVIYSIILLFFSYLIKIFIWLFIKPMIWFFGHKNVLMIAKLAAWIIFIFSSVYQLNV